MREVPTEYFAVRFRNMAEATRSVAAIQSLIDCDLGAAFRQGHLEARIYASKIEWEPLLYFSRGAKAAARLAGVQLPQCEGPVTIEEEGHASLLTIPRASLEKATQQLEESALNAADRALKVLIVEDEKDTAMMLADLIEAWGCRAAIAPTGRAARELATRFHPRVVLLDLGLPDEHGYRVAQDLRRTIPASEISIVVVTGWPEPVNQPLTADTGISHHLMKPVNIEALRTILDGYKSAA